MEYRDRPALVDTRPKLLIRRVFGNDVHGLRLTIRRTHSLHD
jgi:hypothetical protein